MLGFTNTTKSLPVVRLRLTENKVCSDKRMFDKSKGRYLYYLLRQSEYGSCGEEIGGYKTDPRYENIGQVNERQLFDENGVTPYISLLPKYDMSSTSRYNWNLYQNSYFVWFNKCDKIEGHSRDEILKHMKNAISVSSAQLTLMIICILNTIIVSFMIGCPKVYFLWKLMDKGRDEDKKVYYICELVDTSLKWLFLVLKIFSFRKCIQLINLYSDSIHIISKAECSEKIANKTFEVFG